MKKTVDYHHRGWPTLQFEPDEIFHIGTLVPQDKRYSYEGHTLSFSPYPAAWRRIADLFGKTHHLYKPNNQFLDFHALTNNQRELIWKWGIEHHYVQPCEIYGLCWFDSELDDEVTCWYENSEERDQEALAMGYDLSLDKIDKEAGIEEGLITKSSYKACPKLEEAVGQRVEVGLTFDLLTLIFTEHELGIDGVYWNDMYDRYYSAPRGGIFPSRLHEWEITSADDEPDHPDEV